MWNGDHAMKVFTFLKSRVLKILKYLSIKNIIVK